MNSAAGIVIFDNMGRVLLLNRTDEQGWGLPGGKCEDGETFLAAAVRETKEETGWTPTRLRPVKIVTNPDGFHFCCFRADSEDAFSPAIDPAEHIAAQWFEVAALPAQLFMCTADLVASAGSVAAMDRNDINGWLEVRDNPISVAGVYPYRGASLPEPAEADKIYNVLRPPEELSDPETIASIKLVPWIDDHTMLGDAAGGIPAEEKGIAGVVGEDVYFENDTLYANIKLFSSAQARKVGAGKKELSLGYQCKYEYAPGVYLGQPYDFVQRCIRGNHIASVGSGRMGPMVAVLDHFDVTFDEDDMADVTKEDDKEKKPAEGETAAAKDNADGGGEKKAMTMEEIGAAIAAFAPVVEQYKALQAAVSGGGEKTDTVATDEEEKKDDKKPTAVAMDHADFLRMTGQRDKLVNRLTPFVGVFDHAEMTQAQVTAYGLEKLGLSGKAPKGQEAGYLAGYLVAREETPQRRQQSSVAMDAADAPVKSEWLKAAGVVVKS